MKQALKKNGPVIALLIALSSYIGLDLTGFVDDIKTTTLEQPGVLGSGDYFMISDSSQTVDIPEPTKGDAGFWFVFDAVITIDKTTDDPGRPSNSYDDVYILLGQFVFYSDPSIPFLEVADKAINKPAGGHITKAYNIRFWSGK